MISQILIRNITDEVYAFILDEQLRLKKERKSNVSIGTTISKMLRDYKICREKNNFIPEDHE